MKISSLRQSLVAVLFVGLLSFSGLVQATPILNITTFDTPLSIPVGSTVNATYTITNTSGIALTDLKIHAPALTAVDPVGTTCGNTLGIGDVCAVRLTIGPSQLPGTLLLKPLGACAFGGHPLFSCNERSENSDEFWRKLYWLCNK